MVRRKSKFRKDGIRKHESHATFFEFQSKMSDGDYVPGPDQIVPNIGGQKKRVMKTTILSKCWPEIKKLSEKGTGPHDIANILNAKLKPQDHLGWETNFKQNFEDEKSRLRQTQCFKNFRKFESFLKGLYVFLYAFHLNFLLFFALSSFFSF